MKAGPRMGARRHGPAGRTEPVMLRLRQALGLGLALLLAGWVGLASVCKAVQAVPGHAPGPAASHAVAVPGGLVAAAHGLAAPAAAASPQAVGPATQDPALAAAGLPHDPDLCVGMADAALGPGQVDDAPGEHRAHHHHHGCGLYCAGLGLGALPAAEVAPLQTPPLPVLRVAAQAAEPVRPAALHSRALARAPPRHA